MPKSRKWFKTGKVVEVRSADQILRTLDENGALDGLPFMPEMLEFCGKSFRVSRRVEKTCVEWATLAYDIREFENDDVVFLEDLRCPGTSHDGCQRACMLFWKTRWLSPAGRDRAPDPAGPDRGEAPEARLRTRTAAGGYLCQSTELKKATIGMSRTRRLSKCVSVVASGDVTLPKMIALIVLPVFRKIIGRRFSPVAGILARTPTENLDLRAGELVEVKSVGEIAGTLDPASKNRGLVYDKGLGRFSGRRFRVRNRLDSMILEPTGEMIRPKATVVLDGPTCLCNNVLGGCPRREVIFWREIWLKRADRLSPESGPNPPDRPGETR